MLGIEYFAFEKYILWNEIKTLILNFFLYCWLLVAFNTMQKSLCVCRKKLAAGFARYALQNAAYYFTGEDAEQTYQCGKQSSTVCAC